MSCCESKNSRQSISVKLFDAVMILSADAVVISVVRGHLGSSYSMIVLGVF